MSYSPRSDSMSKQAKIQLSLWTTRYSYAGSCLIPCRKAAFLVICKRCVNASACVCCQVGVCCVEKRRMRTCVYTYSSMSYENHLCMYYIDKEKSFIHFFFLLQTCIYYRNTHAHTQASVTLLVKLEVRILHSVSI